MSVSTNNVSTASQYQPTSNGKDSSAGILESKVGGALSYQIGTKEQGLSGLLPDGMKLSDSLKQGGKVRIGPNLDGIENIGHQSYTPNSEDELGFSAISATGFQHTHASDIKADSVIRVGGVEAQAEALYKAGVIGKNEQGHYVVPGQEGGSTTGKK